ncbi:MAG TPA: type II secretion system F family protein [Cytophagaceae bacterium]|nr:type II secretion system F family protein [Cytophagaceae bacterium]
MAVDITKVKTNQKIATPASKEEKGIFDFLNKDISLFGNNLSDKKKEAFYHELHILLTAGVDIRSTLDLIAFEQTSEKDKTLFIGIRDQVTKGSTLSDAVQNTGKFSIYEYHSLRIGEESGKLSVVLKELADFFQSNINLRRQIVGALTYPAIVLCTSFGAIFFMLNFIVPMFADVFKRFGGKLPFITSVIVDMSNWIGSYFYLVFLILAIVVGFLISQRKHLWYRKFFSLLIIRIPFVGDMIRKIYMARFCHSMALLIGAKIPIVRAIKLVKEMIGFYPIEVSLDQVEQDIMQGVSLHKSLAAFPVYHRRLVSLVKVGEEVNQLEMFFGKIAKQYSEDVEHQTSLISSMIEPFMIIFLGLIVGVILIAMYLPLFQLSTTF